MTTLKTHIGKHSIKVKDCRGLSSIKGLMFDKMESYDGALISGNSIWMPFVFHDLDLLFLDDQFRILEIKKAAPISLHPKTWKTYTNSGAKYCLEIRSGIIDAMQTNLALEGSV